MDQTDPNPAHRLKHSLKELTLSQGRRVNPRFAEKRVKTDHRLIRRFSSSDIDRSSKGGATEKHKLQKSNTLGGLISPQQLQEDTTGFIVERPNILDPLPSDREMEKNLSYSHAVSKYGTFSFRNYDNHSTDSEDNTTDEQTTCIESNVLGSKSMDNTTDANDMEPLFTDVYGQCSNQTPEQDIDIYDIEVTNSASETTVVLKNLFSKSSLSKENEPSNAQRVETNSSYSCSQINEDSDESEEEVLLVAYTNTFPHGIPKLIVSNEIEDVVEVIVNPPTCNGVNETMQGTLSEVNTDDHELNMSDLVLSSLQGEPCDEGLSVNENDDGYVVGGLHNESGEEEESALSTRL